MTSFDEAVVLMPLDEYYEQFVDPKPNIPKRYSTRKQRKAAHLQSYKDDDEDDDENEDEFEGDEQQPVDEDFACSNDSNQIQIEFETNEFNQVYDEPDDPMGLKEEIPSNSVHWRIQPNNVNRPTGAPPLVPINSQYKSCNNLQKNQQRNRNNRNWNFRNNNNNYNNYRNNRNNSRVPVHDRLGMNMKPNWQRGYQQRNNFNGPNTKNHIMNSLNNNNNCYNNNNQQQMQNQQVLMNTNNQFNTNQQPNNNNYNQQQHMFMNNQFNTNQLNNNVQQQQQKVLMNLSIPPSNLNLNRQNIAPVYQTNNYQGNNGTNTENITSLISLANSGSGNQSNMSTYQAQAQVMRTNNNSSINGFGSKFQPKPINQTNSLQRATANSGGVVASETLRLADLMNINKDDDTAINLREVAKNAMMLLSGVVHKPTLNKGVQQVLSNIQQKQGNTQNTTPSGLEMSINPQVTKVPMSNRFTTN